MDKTPEIVILRLGHRLPRDERMSTHVALVARAFGARRMVYSGQHDSGLEESVARLVGNWGGNFTVTYEKNFRKVIKEHKASGYVVCHLTMYGMPLVQKLEGIRKAERLLVVVGSEAVPGEVYQLADFNVSVTGQPHSEVAALAITLDRLMEGRELEAREFGGKIRIAPSERGKKVKRTG